MDRLATQSVGFRHAYCPAPLCNPSRPATMTGIATHHNGVTANAEFYDQQTAPREHTNRIADPALKSVREAMNGQLDQRIQAGPFPYDTGTSGRSTGDAEEGAGRKRAAGKRRS